MRAIQFIPYLLIILLLAFFLISFPFMPHLDHLAMNQIHMKSHLAMRSQWTDQIHTKSQLAMRSQWTEQIHMKNHLAISNEISYSMYGADLHDFSFVSQTPDIYAYPL